MTRLDNLWILDERLAFSARVASEYAIGEHPELPSDGTEIPDILIFDKQFVLSEDVESPLPYIAVIEFKRPDMKIYSLVDSPVQQIINTIKRIRTGEYEDSNGRRRDDFRNTPILVMPSLILIPRFEIYANGPIGCMSGLETTGIICTTETKTT